MTTGKTDLLTEVGSPSGLLIAHFGDPAYTKIGPAEPAAINNFMQVIGYLLFAEAISVPTRFILDGEAMYQAAHWARPLLIEGLVIPERRSGPTSFVDLARERNTPEIGVRRAEFLDNAAQKVRAFAYRDLGDHYRRLLSADLADGGAFRRLVPGGVRGSRADALSTAHAAYESGGDFNPESFAQAVGQVLPDQRRKALRWAMARYYTTPLAFDASNTRQLPRAAAELLVQAGVLDRTSIGLDTPAPVANAVDKLTSLHSTLATGLVANSAEAYCEALLATRQRIPEARRLFTSLTAAAHANEAGADISAAFQQELQKQLRVRRVPGKLFKLSTVLVTGVAGAEVSMLAGGGFELQAAVGTASAAVGSAIEKRIADSLSEVRARRKAPWVLAVETFENEFRTKSSE